MNAYCHRYKRIGQRFDQAPIKCQERFCGQNKTFYDNNYAHKKQMKNEERVAYPAKLSGSSW